MSVARKPEDRVLQFIFEWFNAWSEFAYQMDMVDVEMMDEWLASERTVKRRHFVAKACEYDGGSFSWTHANHDPELETVIQVQLQQDSALVETRLGDEFSAECFYEYQLRLVDGDWRIETLNTFFEARGQSMYSTDDRQKILSQTSLNAALPMLEAGIDPDCSALFQEGRETQAGVISIKPVGELRLQSGILGAYDLGWQGADFRPLKRSVLPGEYPVEVAVAGDLHLAVRIVFSSAPVAEWRPAFPVGEQHNQIGVDTANVCLFDAEAFMKLDSRAKDQLYNRMTEAGGVVNLGRIESKPDEAPDCIYVISGMGDGGYPAYWGLDELGMIACFVVDFLVAAEFGSMTIEIPWNSSMLNDPIRHHLLDEYDLQLTMRSDFTDGNGLKVVGERFLSARLFDDQGNLVYDSDRGGLMETNGYRFYYAEDSLEDVFDGNLIVKISTGYTN